MNINNHDLTGEPGHSVGLNIYISIKTDIFLTGIFSLIFHCVVDYFA